jgi:phosphoribosylaminoimidazolecarboxamide formyltransferase/IMP cyclohydrolase
LTQIPFRRALISVYDKAGLEELASGLHAAGVEIVSTGTTAARIAAAGVPVTRVEELTGFPECLDGRVKTLHPRVHAGLLADMANPAHETQLAELGIEPFQLVVSNLYPFEATVASGAAPDECVEQIDIGGPSMVRAAAKNHGSVAVVTDPSRYADVLAAVPGGFTLDQRRQLAAEAFAHTAAYDVAVASWFASAYAPDETARDAGWPAVTGALWHRADVLRYGENPHQRAALYTRPGAPFGIAAAELLHGKAMSYNNYVDADAARRAAYDFAEPCAAIIKHSNPCGIAVGADLADAHAKANACDPTSAFGGVIAVNGPVTAALARQIAEIFTEVVIAPDFGAEALDILSASKNVRLLRCPGGYGGAGSPPMSGGGPGGPAPPPPPPPPPRGGGGGGGPVPPRSSSGPLPAGCCSSPRTGWTSPVTTRRTGSSRPGRRPLRNSSRIWPSRGRHVVRSNRMPSCWPRPEPRSGWAWARSTGWTRRAWRCSAPGTGRPARSRPATRTSRSPTASRSWPMPGWPRWSSRAARSGTT